MPYDRKEFSGKNTYDALLNIQDPHVANSQKEYDEWAAERYLVANRSNAGVQWLSDHLREDQRLTGSVYVAIRVLSDQAAGCEKKLYKWHPDAKVDGDESAKEPLPRSHPAARLFHRPNAHDSFRAIMKRMVQQLMLTGSSYQWKVLNGFNKPFELWQIPTGTIQPVPISVNYPDGAYRIAPWYPGPLSTIPTIWGTGGVVISSENICRTVMPHPLVQAEGLSPLAACSLALDTLESIDRARFTKVRRGIKPSGLIESDKAVSYPSPQEMARAKTQMRQLFGGASHAGEVAFVPPGYNFKELDQNVEVGWIDSWSQLQSFVMSIYGITKSLAFMSEDATYATLYASLKQFNLFTMMPLLDLIADAWNHTLIEPYFGEDIHLELSPKRIDDPELLEQQLDRDLRAGIRTVEEMRKIRQLPLNVEFAKERAWDKSKPQEEMDAQQQTQDSSVKKPVNTAGLGSLGSRNGTKFLISN